MTTLAFDTLKLARKLEAAGFPAKQAGDTAAALAESLDEIKGLATKEDIAALKVDIARLQTKTEAAKNEMLRWLAGAVALLLTAMVVLKFVP